MTLIPKVNTKTNPMISANDLSSNWFSSSFAYHYGCLKVRTHHMSNTSSLDEGFFTENERKDWRQDSLVSKQNSFIFVLKVRCGIFWWGMLGGLKRNTSLKGKIGKHMNFEDS
jgi:hypothetical protein